MRSRSLPLFAVGLLAAVALVGCGGSKGQTLQVTVVPPSTMKLEDTDEIAVAFVPADGSGQSAAGGGNFKSQPFAVTRTAPGTTGVVPGKYKITVKITAYAGMGKADRAQKLEDFSKAYNADASKLVYEVTADPNQSIAINLENSTVTKK